MSSRLQNRAANLAISAAEMLIDDLDTRREQYQAQVEAWNAWLEIDDHDGTEDDAPEEPKDTPPLPDRHTLYACQVAAAAARNHAPGRPKERKRSPVQRRSRKP